MSRTFYMKFIETETWIPVTPLIASPDSEFTTPEEWSQVSPQNLPDQVFPMDRWENQNVKCNTAAKKIWAQDQSNPLHITRHKLENEI